MALDHVARNLDGNLGLDEVARIAEFSSSSDFSRSFKGRNSIAFPREKIQAGLKRIYGAFLRARSPIFVCSIPTLPPVLLMHAAD